MATVRANQSIVVVLNGSPQAVRDGDRYDSKDQVVREFPWLFVDNTVEAATAAPGERRNVRRSS